MKNSTIVTIIVVLIVIIGGAFYFSQPKATPDIADDPYLPPGSDATTTDPIIMAFRDELTRTAIENMNGAMPIEGFDADLLLSAYPGGLVPADFDGVETFEGIYSYTSGDLRYERTVEQPVSSAERTVSDEGYKTLLENVSERLDVQIENAADATALVGQLSQ